MSHYGVTFQGTQQVRAVFGTPPNLTGQQFVNVRFVGADLQNAKVDGATFQNVEFINCKLQGIDFSKSTFVD